MTRIALTAEEKVMLHLLRYSRFQDQWDVPFAVTQKGISNATRILRNNIPRTMKKLLDRGYLQKKTVHVRGAVKRMAVYFLTIDGNRKAKSMDDILRETYVQVKDFKGKTKKARVGEISQYLSDNNIPLLDIVHHMAETGVFDCKSFRKETMTKEERLVDFAAHVPKLKYFFDRKNQLNSISKWLKSESHKLLVLYGIAGCGKTTLANKVVSTLKNRMNVFWYQFHEWDTIRNVLGSISKFLAQVGRRDFKSYNNVKDIIDINEITENLETQLQNSNALLVFDDFHKANIQIVSFFLALKERLERVHGVKAIIIGRHVTPFYDSRDIFIKNLVSELHLGGLDEEGSLALLKMRKIENPERIIKLTEGHPLFLELIAPDHELKKENNLVRYIHEQIFSKLTDDEKSVLNFISVFRYPIPWEVLLIYPDSKYETIGVLKNKSLIYEVLKEKFDAHELVKEFFYRALTPQLKYDYHRIAAKHYLEIGDGFSTIEAQYHYLSAGDYEQAAKLAITQGPDLINSGHIEEFLNLLNEFNAQNLQIDHLLSITILKGKIYTMMNSLDDALRCYDHARVLNEKVQSRMKEAEMHRQLGDLLEKKLSLGQALKHYQKSLELTMKLHNPAEIAKSYQGLGRLHRKLKHYDKAKDFYMKSIALLERLGDELEVAKCYNQLGQIFAAKGDLSKTLEHYEKCIEMSEKLDNPYLTGLSAFLAAYAYTDLRAGQTDKDWEDMLEHHERYANISKKMGFERGMAHGLNNACKTYVKKSQFDKALGYLDKVLETSERLNENLMRSTALKNYGIIYKHKKDYNKSIKYFQDSIKILEDEGMSYHLGDTYFQAALAYKDKGNKKKADNYITKAINQYEKLGATDKIELIKEKLAST